uniref:Butyrophilin subfamily 1 member A1-like isoform X1 n=1 Tax=Camelus bactrianus TaxID=9837 RepID=A0A9W3FFQ7_CAMBA|nr:butyrophilin subfamily 1 member A1-like isoform X1 [Camelus bactrianus]XP_010972483.1 butyrophilin subfamily 1 member A1-like isoform X1 [Camelus bactrianus]XP_010972485.1 butyrophilin subfamily 1 member A1-like isoform X1 [Camelus bactrianus]
MCLDKDGTGHHHGGEACSSSTRRCQVRGPEHSPFSQQWDFTEDTAGQKEAGIMPSTSGSGALFLKDFPWAAAQTSLLLLLGLLLLAALGFIWKLRQEKVRECWTKEKLQRELCWRKAQKVDDWRKARSHAVHVTLDPDTAYPELFLSEDHRSVRRRNMWQDLPERTGRFFFDPCVLGHESFSSGRHYWEVEVGDRTYWELGVCEENVERTWGITESPQNGFWAMELYANNYQALSSPRTALPLGEPLSRVGIFVDYEAGDVSFYSGADGSHIYTFPQASFSGPLRPFFCLWFYHPTPLTICH